MLSNLRHNARNLPRTDFPYLAQYRTGQSHNLIWSIFCYLGFGQLLKLAPLFLVTSFCSFLCQAIHLSLKKKIKAIVTRFGSRSARLWEWAKKAHEDFPGEKEIPSPAAWHFLAGRDAELKAEGAFATTIKVERFPFFRAVKTKMTTGLSRSCRMACIAPGSGVTSGIRTLGSTQLGHRRTL